MTRKPVKSTEDMLVLKKIHLVLGIIGAIIASLIIPTVTVTMAYSRAKADVEDKINAIQYQNVSTFAKSDDLKELRDKLVAIQVDVSEIKGYLLLNRKPSKGDLK